MKLLENLFGMSVSEINQIILKISINLGVALTILILGFWFSKFASRSVKKMLIKGNFDIGLVSFISSLTGTVLKILVFITAINQAGVQMTSFVAILGAAGLAIGMAFSGTLSNLAGGIMILVFKPFKVGEMIFAQGETGTVKEIHIFNTYLSSPDNKVIIIPNGPLANGNIVNFTRSEERRVDINIGIAYGSDMKIAREKIMTFILEDERILREPAPFIGLGAMTDYSIQMNVRVWTSVANYYPVFYHLNERIYHEFEDHNIQFPASQKGFVQKTNVTPMS